MTDYGPNLVANSGFTSNASWVWREDWQWSGSYAYCYYHSVDNDFYQIISITSGDIYRVSFRARRVGATGTITCYLGGDLVDSIDLTEAWTTYTYDNVVAGNTNALIMFGALGVEVNLDDVYVQEETEPLPLTPEYLALVTEKVRTIPFIYSSEIAYEVELGNQYMRFFYDDTVLLDAADDEVWIDSPYLEEHLFQLQYRQVGDVMWITHPLYAPRKLTRTSATSFALTAIPFKNGPFMTRNDLIDPDNPSNITMTTSVTGEPVGTAKYSLTGHNIGDRHGDNFIKNNWWDGIAAHGVNGSQADYCGGGRASDGRPVYITYTVTYDTPVEELTEINIDYICMSRDQGADLTLNTWTKRGLRVYDSVEEKWTVVVNPEIIDTDFPATVYKAKPAKLIGLDATAVITGSWTNISRIEIYLLAYAKEYTTACAIFNVSAGTETYIPGTLTASSDYFETGHEGALFKLIHKRTITAITLNHAGYSPALYTKGTFRFGTHGRWAGTVELQRNDNDAGWDTYRTYIGKNDRNIQEAFVEEGDNVQYRIYVHSGMTGDFGSDLTLDNVFREGIVRIVSVGDTVYWEDDVVTYEDEIVIIVSRTVANIAVVTPIEMAEATKRWAEGAWSDLRGFPTSVTFFEGRCIYGGMQTILPSEAKLLTVWPSETDDYENFEEGVKAADSFVIVVPSSNDIMWIEALEALVVGTSGDEWRIGSNRMEQPITPTNYTVRQQSSYGSAYIQAVRVNDQILFVDFVGRKVRELIFNGDKYVSRDLTALSEHITLSGIVDMALQKNPDTILWCVLDDGSFVAKVYEREQNVVAWWKVPIDGFVQSACVTPGETEDKVSIAILRTIVGDIVYCEGDIVTYEGKNVTLADYCIYIERFAPRVFGTDIEDAFFVDCGATFESTTPTTTVTGATHLVGETVAILADGVVQASKVVDKDGEFELDAAASKVQYGLPFVPVLEPMKPVVNTQMGTTAASIASAKEMGISFLDTAGATYGASLDNMFTIDFDDPQWVNASKIEGLFTGTVNVSVDGGFSLEQPLIISSDSPLPLTVRAIIPKMDVTGR